MGPGERCSEWGGWRRTGGFNHPVTEQLLEPSREGMAAPGSCGMLGTGDSRVPPREEV